MAQVVLAEKPSAASKIAYALGAKIRKKIGSVYYYTNSKQDLIVANAVGHLFTLAKKRGAEYPCFDLDWKPTYMSSSDKFSKKYFSALEKISKKADSLVIATDYDIEGEVIGLNVMKYIFGKKDASRMKFSTLTVFDLVEAYKNRSKSLDWGQANAGETRHYLDWYYGVNLSQALSKAVASAENKRVVLSIGRVQGPALALLSEREQEIKKFKPEPFWLLKSIIKIKNDELEAEYSGNELRDKEKAQNLFEKAKRKKAVVSDTKDIPKKVLPPLPFDLTSLQLEAYRVFGFSPKKTLQIAQNLYTKAYISYPRTSSQKLPYKLGFKKILQNLAKQSKYFDIVKEVLKTELKPNQGKKEDSAHPAIYPTGHAPKSLNKDDAKLYDLIVKRFFAVFGEAGERTTAKIVFDINGMDFSASATRTTKLGWMKWYLPYSKRKEGEVPKVEKGEEFSQKPFVENKETQPPKRYSQASIVRELEKRNLGTKATRSSIVDILFDRKYIVGREIEVTELGLKVFSLLKKYAPTVLDENLTRDFEIQMDKIREKKSKPEKVLEQAKKIVTEIYKDISKHELKLGHELFEAFKDVRKAETELMTCLKCNKGKMVIRFSKKTKKRFLACNAYPKCMNCWPLPQKGKLVFLDNNCKECGARKIAIFSSGRKPWFLCPNPNCKTKEEYTKLKSKKKTIKKSKKD